MFVPALIAVAVVEVLAFVEVGRTVGWPLAVVLLLGISVVGTRNVISVAAEFGVPQLVCASTGKALRPYSADVYTASKRAAEWLLAAAAARGEARYSAARFTHVVDKSIIYARLLDWCQGDGI